METVPNTDTAPSRFPTFKTIGARVFSHRTLQVLVFLALCLVTLVALVYAIENWRGKRAWEKFKRAAEAQGEQFDIADFVPAPVPDEQNFAATPLLRPLLNYELTPATGHVFSDTNGFRRASDFGNWRSQHKFPGSTDSWRQSEFTDLADWKLYLQKQHGNAALWSSLRSNTTVMSVLTSEKEEPANSVLAALSIDQLVMDELRTASQRPASRFNIHYEENYDALLPHLTVLKKACQMFALSAAALLAQGKTEAAFADTEAALAMANAIATEPFMISIAVRATLLDFALQPVWEGLARHGWSPQQLQKIERTLGQIDLLSHCNHALRAERAFNLEFIDLLSRPARTGSTGATSSLGENIRLMQFAPRGWLDQNKLRLSQAYADYLFPLVDAPKQRVYASSSQASMPRFAVQFASPGPYTFLVRMLFPYPALHRWAATQTGVNQALIACALERYRHDQGAFPDRLDALQPKYLEKIPHDLITGEPLKFRKTGPGSFILYSVGWNEKDDGGVPASPNQRVLREPSSPSAAERNIGDWVWKYHPD